MALGDSITDGAITTVDANHRWPDFLARRLRDRPGLRHLGVLNKGIGGNRLLHDGNPLPAPRPRLRPAASATARCAASTATCSPSRAPAT